MGKKNRRGSKSSPDKQGNEPDEDYFHTLNDGTLGPEARDHDYFVVQAFEKTGKRMDTMEYNMNQLSGMFKNFLEESKLSRQSQPQA